MDLLWFLTKQICMTKNYSHGILPFPFQKFFFHTKFLGTRKAKGNINPDVSPSPVVYYFKPFSIHFFNALTVMKNFTTLAIIVLFTSFVFGQTPCPGISPLDCDQVNVCLPINLNFDGTDGGILTTGFTMVDSPSSPLSADEDINDADAP